MALLAAVGCGLSHPEDRELLDRFSRHRAELNQLVRMFQEDKGLGRVGATFTRPDDPGKVGVSAARVAEYRRLCAAIGAPDCIEGYDATLDRLYGTVQAGRTEAKDPIWVHVSASGLAVSGSSKGYYYSAKPEFEVVATLDGLALRKSGTWLRHVEGLWYLYFDFED